jgi:hypothetical protein
VTGRRTSAFIDALAAGRRPSSFRADPEDVALLRTAISLRAARPGDAIPDEQFMADLYEDLAEQTRPRIAPDPRPARLHRGRTAIAAIAASLVLVGGTVLATESLSQPVTATVQAAQGKVLRIGTFESANKQVVGQIVAYRGHPSWVYMKLDVPNYNGSIVCNLHVDNGSTVAVGAFVVHGGKGRWVRNIRVDAGRLRGATLVTTSGSVLASASIS